MPNRRFDWHEHVKEVEGEYRAARIAVDRLKSQVVADPNLLEKDDRVRLRDADRNLEGTYLVRLLPPSRQRSARTTGHSTTIRIVRALRQTLIDSIGGRRGQGISTTVREGAHAVRELHNCWRMRTKSCLLR